MTTIALPRAVENFVTANNAHDGDALVAVFAPGATVSDDGKTYGTVAEIRDWTRSHLLDPRIVITPVSYADGRLVASGDGDFPGGPAVFAFTFATDGDLVTDLAIEPA